MTNVTMPAAIDPVLIEKAAAIHALVKRTHENTVEIGRHLAEARDQVDHGAWLTWINTEFGWSDQTARNLIHLYKLSLDPNSKCVLDLDLPLRVLYQLAAPKAEAARQEIAERIKAGEQVPLETVIKAVTGRRKKPQPEPSPGASGADGNVPGVSGKVAGAVDDTAEVTSSTGTGTAGNGAGECDPNSAGTVLGDGEQPGGGDCHPQLDSAALAAAAVNRLGSTELQSFLAQLSPAHRRAIEQVFGRRDSDNTNAEIATLAGECTALLAHPKQHVAEIHKKLARIKRLAGGKSKDRDESLGKSNAHLDLGAFLRGMRLDGRAH